MSKLVNYISSIGGEVGLNNVPMKENADHNQLFSDQRLKALVQHGSDIIAILDVDLKYTYISPTSLKILGVSPETFIGRQVQEFIHQDDLDLVMAEAADLKTIGHVQFTPFRVKNVNGDWKWLETKATNLINDSFVGGIVCNSKDITDKIISQEKIVESVERYNIVSKATSDIIREYKIDSNTVVWNKGLRRILKFKEAVTDVQWWEKKIHPEDRQRVLTKFEANIRNRAAGWEEEYRFRCGDGVYKYLIDRVFVAFDQDGEPSRMIGSMQDISARKEDEHWSKLLESVVTNTTDGVLITNAPVNSSPLVIYVNDALVKMSGYSRADLLHRNPELLNGGNYDQPGLKLISKALINKEACNTEIVNFTKQGKAYHVSINIFPITNTTGAITHWISIQRDITENRNYVNAIEEQNRKLREIRWVQSHLVRGPLTRIMGLVDLLKKFEPGDDREQLLEYLSKSANELDEVIGNISNSKVKSN